MNFVSDNAYGAAPEILAAIAAANEDTAPPYGRDAVTARLKGIFSNLFERDVSVFPVITGTAANALSLSTLVPPYGAIFCHTDSHIAVDECGAPEFYAHGAKLIPIDGSEAKLSPPALETAISRLRKGDPHSVQPAAVSVTQATERGTVYSVDEIKAISGIARSHGMKLHMDGARFANAVAHLRCSAADITWRAGVDALSFGATKNGALGAEAVVFFDSALVGDFEYRRMKGGHLLSKTRFVSAQLEAYVSHDLWLRQAARANALAQKLAQALREISNIEIATAPQANAVFARMPNEMVKRLRKAGAQFYEWENPQDGKTVIRLVTSFATPEQSIAGFLAAVKG
ncbi:MAG: low specificity L-threonine aldolase [Proteobacteria bacterium]|nr:low specificity L-threonine aldolase [Pseudomonadota bacterium]